MPRIDSEKFYKAALKQYGATAYGLHWASDAHQSLRFEKILTFLDEDLRNNTLVDAGCGFGDFYSFLHTNGLHVNKYIGIDSLKEMCDIAREKTECEIIRADITKVRLPVADYYICSGALNILTPFETELFIRNCFSSCTKGFVFNALYGDKKSDTYNYITMQTIQSLAKRLHVKRIKFEEGYIKHDITVGFFK
ncbi:class I SAM-dependent methyltransferase [Sulfurimonas sp. SWIR-19]|uniref:class I SAM-dependent methyltransferase n=1 Tax=Sulfurimonas sp. SWIR-19 TaxID=2878390 RepID=UPI001CF43B0D|nr:class I SAM-dependent methyltransferase [Sulfurimonas sp. SWIR-19]UCN00464.1 class I SAM-dependent methyltransferase [Sulfurimonas sp. SWIR-19]